MMRAMKNSGVSWIGTIPVDWEVRRTKYCFTVNHGSDPKTDSGNTPVYGSGNNSFKTCEEFKVGPAVLVGRKGTINIPQWIEGNYWNVDTAFDVQPKGNYDLKLYYYASMCFDYDAVATQTALPSMTQFDYLNFRLPFMDADIQQQIVSYLDAKCDAIDKAIAHKRSVIEKLKEYRTAVITKAVTKGLNPDVEMKDSGCYFHYKFPVHWKLNKLNRICKVVTDFVASGSFASLAENVHYLDYPDYAMLIRTADLSGKGYDSQPVYIDKHSYDFLRNSNLFGGELMLPNIGASIGDIYIVPKLYKRMSLAPNSIMIKTKQIDKYFYYFFKSEVGRLKLLDISQATAQSKFNKTQLRQLRVLEPPLNEQQQIVDYLDDKCNKIDSAIQQQEQIIAKLEEYRKSVIYYAVTGKKEVSA